MMASKALTWWRSSAQEALDNMLRVHAALGGTGAKRRLLEQVNNAYAVLLSSQFQKFCRDLHSEAADYIASTTPFMIRRIVLLRFTEGRKLDTGNPNPGNLGSDFNRFGLKFWDEISLANPKNAGYLEKLKQLNLWRNAISHHDFGDLQLAGRTSIRLKEISDWRRACDGLAGGFDQVLLDYLLKITGIKPW
jgi:hypothetical protein